MKTNLTDVLLEVTNNLDPFLDAELVGVGSGTKLLANSAIRNPERIVRDGCSQKPTLSNPDRDLSIVWLRSSDFDIRIAFLQQKRALINMHELQCV